MSNRDTYRKGYVVREYAGSVFLQPPEVTVLNLLKDRLPDMKMLDIGVGGGRTTHHFAPVAKEYVGVDYSDGMIEVCKAKFADPSSNMSFQVCDAQDMEAFSDDTFDFVLFSFNGLDSLSHTGRLKAFSEVHRVGKPGGYFCFSSHNLQSVGRLLSLQGRLSANPIRSAKKVLKWFLLKHVYNRHIRNGELEQDHVTVNDGILRFGLSQYYVRPVAQVRQLEPHFDDIRVFGLLSGQEVKGNDALSVNDDAWLYYLCRIKDA